MLNTGEKVFVAGYGAGIMTKIEDDKKYNVSKKYINISFLLNNIDLYIPEDKLSNYKIRNIATKETIEESLKIVNEIPKKIDKKWSKRYRQNNDKIKEGDTLKICEVIRDLYYLSSQGTIPPGERKILSKAESMLASELALVFDISVEKALDKIRNLSKQFIK